MLSCRGVAPHRPTRNPGATPLYRRAVPAVTTDALRRHLLACGFLALVTLVVLGDVLFFGGGRILSHGDDDLAKIFLAWQQFGFGELRRGNLALWNPHVYAGTPFFGGFQAGLLYPPSWLHLVLPAAAANNCFIALHVWLAGVGVYCWTARRRLHPLACVLAGVVFMLGGAYFLQIYRGHLPNLATAAWIPFVVLAIDGVLATFAPRWVLIGMAAVALQILAGHVQYLLYTAIVAGLYALPGWWRSHHRLRDGAALVALYAGGAALGAVQLGAGLDAVSESLRTGLRFEMARTFALPPENLVTLFAPGVFGDMVGTPYWGRWTLSETSLFVGVAPLLLAVFGAASGEARITRRCLVMTAVSLLLAVGDATPLFRLLYDTVPGFRSFRGLAKFTPLATLFLAMLVAVGCDRVLRAERIPRWLVVLGLVVACGCLASGGVLWVDGTRHDAATWQRLLSHVDFTAQGFRYFVAGRDPTSAAACVQAATSLLVAGVVFALTATLALLARRGAAFRYGLVACGICELVVHARYFRPTFDPAPLAAASAAVRDAVAQANADADVDDARVVSPARAPYLALSAGLDDVWGAEPMILGRYARFVAATQGSAPDAILTSPGLRTLSPALGLVRLRHQIRLDDGVPTLVRTGFPTLSRALLVQHWRVLESPDAVFTALGNPGFHATHLALLEADPGLGPAPTTPENHPEEGSVTIVDLSTDALEVRADTAVPAILLLSDNYSAGWHATSLDDDARSYAVLPVDYILRGVALPAGAHHFRLEYRPRAFVVGAWVSALAVVAYAAVLTVSGVAAARARR